MAERLPDADGKTLKKAYEAKAEDIRTSQRAMREAGVEVRRALRADPFDAKAVDAAMGKVTQERMHMQQALQGVIAAAAADMSKEGRERLARRPEAAGPREPGRDGRDGERRGPPPAERNR